MSERKLSVLVVEDGPVPSRVATRVLSRLGHDVVAASDGCEALGLIERGTFDVVLMDVQMPIMDGLEATRHIRRQERLSHRRVPVIAVTAGNTEAEWNACKAAGMDDLITKPIDRVSVEAAFDRVFGRTVSRPSPQPLDTGFDINRLMRAADDDREIAVEIVNLFASSWPALMGRLREAALDGSRVAVAQAAHAIKGMAASLGAGNVVEAARRIELGAETASVEELTTWVDELEELLGALEARARQERELFTEV